MVAHYLWQACLLSAVLVLGATSVHAESSNPEDGSTAGEHGTNDPWPPCDVVLVGTQAPYVDFHPECLPDNLPIGP